MEQSGAGRAPRGFLLSGRPFWGESVLARALNPELLERFQEPESILVLLRAASRCGAAGLITTNDFRVLAALRALGSDQPAVYPVIPNVIGYVRESTHYGMVGAGWRRLKTLRPADLLRIGALGTVRAGKVLARDFSAILELLLEVEMADFRPFQPRVAFLHPVTTDLALAFGNRSLFELYRDRITRRFGCEPGLATNNLGWLAPRLREWGLPFRHILAPFNERGYRMLPSRARCEQVLEEDEDLCLWADRIAIGGLPGAKEFQYLRKAGIEAAVVDVAETADLDQVRAAAEGFIG